MLPDVKKHVTGEILGARSVIHQPQDEPIDPHVMPQIDRLYGALVAGRDAIQELFIGMLTWMIRTGITAKRSVMSADFHHLPLHSCRLCKAAHLMCKPTGSYVPCAKKN